MDHIKIVAPLIVVGLIAGCATGQSGQGPAGERASEDRNCVERDAATPGVRIRTCLQVTAPESLPDEMRRQGPWVVTVVETPAGTFSNPLAWTLEVQRDGQVVARQAFSAPEATVEAVEEGEELEIRASTPIGAGVSIEPGTYRFRYQQQGEEIGTTEMDVPQVEVEE